MWLIVYFVYFIYFIILLATAFNNSFYKWQYFISKITIRRMRKGQRYNLLYEKIASRCIGFMEMFLTEVKLWSLCQHTLVEIPIRIYLDIWFLEITTKTYVRGSFQLELEALKKSILKLRVIKRCGGVLFSSIESVW